jgi:hypothetical protein
MVLLRIGEGIISEDNNENPLIFNLESTSLGDYLYIYGTDGKLYLSYTNNKFHLVRTDRMLINKVLASSMPIQDKIQIFRDQNVSIQINDTTYSKYLYIDVIRQKVEKSYAWLWILVMILVILLFLLICLFMKSTSELSIQGS